jgi:hypothetical protein
MIKVGDLYIIIFNQIYSSINHMYFLILPIYWKFATCCGSMFITQIQMSLHKSICPFQYDFEFCQNFKNMNTDETKNNGLNNFGI